VILRPENRSPGSRMALPRRDKPLRTLARTNTVQWEQQFEESPQQLNHCNPTSMQHSFEQLSSTASSDNPEVPGMSSWGQIDAMSRLAVSVCRLLPWLSTYFAGSVLPRLPQWSGFPSRTRAPLLGDVPDLLRRSRGAGSVV